jgi:hypothetical protein
MVRRIRHIFYRFLPSINSRWHAKRRKGQQSKWQGEEVLECQVEQDRIFWEKVLGQKSKGTFWELDAGDGATGSHGISLEESHGWKGILWEERAKPAEYARKVRQSSVLGGGSGFFNSLIQAFPSPDLIILRNKARLGGLVHEILKGTVVPRWLVIESARAEAETAQLMRSAGYRMVWAFHDDEYYQRSGK